MAGDLKNVAKDAEELLKTTASAAGEKVSEARHRLSRTLESVRATCDKLQDRTAEAAKATDQLIRSHPYESLGIALGLGLLIGVLVSRR